MADLEERILSTFQEKPMIWWGYIDKVYLGTWGNSLN